MHTSASIRKVSKTIVKAYVQHIKEMISKLNTQYILLGVDSDIISYENLFKTVIGTVLNVTTEIDEEYPSSIIKECVTVIEEVINSKGYKQFLENSILSRCVYDVCMLILEKVKQEEFSYSQTY